ncbi:MAG: restriction endonuclease subunit S [Oscillospiraceae bacterium]|nr:restriction endonuclease subunit S [Oscillospiraceae bacterium]
MRWETRRLKTFLTETKETVGTNSANYTLLSLTKEGVIVRDMDGGGKFPSDFGTYKIVTKGQIIFCLFDVDETPRTVGLSRHDGMITGAYDIFNIDNIEPKFLEYYFIAVDNVKGLRPLYTGLRKVVSKDTFMQIKIPLPPRDEQGQIVRYLDWKVSQVNRLINAKQRQIGLLGEQRRKAVDDTIGNTNGEQYRFRHLFSLSKGLGITKADLKEDGIPCVSYGEIHSKYGFEVDPAIHPLKCVDDSYLTSSPKSLLQYGAFVFADTSEDLVGSGNFTYLNSNIKAFAGYHTIIARANRPFKPRYIAYYFASNHYRSQIQQKVNGVKVYSITRTILNSTHVHLPDEAEQARVIAVLDKQCSHIDRAIALLRQELTLFAEYRTRLISDVVTGRVDVRDIMVPEGEIVGDVAANGDADDDTIEMEDE